MYHFTALVTCLSIAFYFYISILVSQARSHDWSEEFRVTSPQDQALRFTGGFNYLRAHTPGGTVYGQTDDYGYNIVDKPVHIHDLQATILYALGIDHTRLTYKYQGRQFRLTDVFGEVKHDWFVA